MPLYDRIRPLPYSSPASPSRPPPPPPPPRPQYDFFGNQLDFTEKPKPTPTPVIPKSPKIEIKTPRVIDKFTETKDYKVGTNPLNEFRSYTYNFTLAAVKDSAIKNLFSSGQELSPKDYFVVAKSGGKGASGLIVEDPGKLNIVNSAPLTIEDEINAGFYELDFINLEKQKLETYNQKVNAAKLIESFNKESPGRFDFYFNNISIDTIPGGSQQTNMSHATSIEFDVFESYSMTGFIEAIHVASVAAGYKSYNSTPFMMKMEFIGYKDDNSPTPVKAENSTRYFLFRFVGLDVDVNQEGTRYRCKGVPFNEIAFSVPDVLKTDLPVSGYQVGPILENLMENLTESMRTAAIKENNAGNFDSYSIVFPKVTESGIDKTYLDDVKNYSKNQIANKTLLTPLKDNGIYKFPKPITTPEDFRAFASNPLDFQFHFSKGSNISDIVQSVIRDSTFTKNILQNLSPDDYGLVEYFFVHVESQQKDSFNNKHNKPNYHYRFVVIPYKIHYTRVFPREDATVDTTKLKNLVHRTYEYFYTGKNLDILKFDLKFNSLFFQAMPMALGNIVGRPETSGIQPEEKSLVSVVSKDTPTSPLGVTTTEYGTDIQGEIVSGMPNSAGTTSDPYAYLAKGMHNAIIQNVDQTTAEIQILGDPYYLCTMGMGNLKYQINTDGTVGLNEAPIYFGDVHILLRFRNPKDRGNVLGTMEFDSRYALYSGLFRITQMRSEFKDGQFTQNINLVRIPMQPEDTNLEGTAPGDVLSATPNPDTAPVEAEGPAPTGINLNDNELLKTALTIPTLGLPGVLSNLVAGAGSVAGALAGGLTVGSLANSVFSGVTGAVTAAGSLVNQVQGQAFQGLANVGSAIRMASSGLSSFSENINSSGGQINQTSKLLNTVGASSVTPDSLAKSLNAAVGLNKSVDLGNQAISAVDSLKDKASGLVSEVSSNIDGINGKANALASQLGININKISGLTADLQTKLTEQFNSLAKSIPENVDLNSAVGLGLILNNIPASNLGKIPATQPFSVSPLPKSNLSDIEEILKRGGNLKNLPGAASIPGIGSVLSSLNDSKSIITTNPLDSSVISQKLVSVQNGLSNVTGNVASVESSIAVVESISKNQVPNITSSPKSVINLFGSSSAKESPLKVAVFIKNSESV